MSIVNAINELSGKEAITIEDAIRNVELGKSSSAVYMPTIYTFDVERGSIDINDINVIEQEGEGITEPSYIPYIEIADADTRIPQAVTTLFNKANTTVILGERDVWDNNNVTWYYNHFTEHGWTFLPSVIIASCLNGYGLLVYNDSLILAGSVISKDRDRTIANFKNNMMVSSSNMSIYALPSYSMSD